MIRCVLILLVVRLLVFSGGTGTRTSNFGYYTESTKIILNVPKILTNSEDQPIFFMWLPETRVLGTRRSATIAATLSTNTI